MPKIAPSIHPPAVYARERRAPTVYRKLLVYDTIKERKAHIIDKSNAFYMHMFPVKCILQQFDHVVPDGMLGGKAFGPRKNFARVERGLFDWEGEGQAEVDHIRRRLCEWVVVSVARRRRVRR